MFVQYDPDCYAFLNPAPGLRTQGCGCCSSYEPCTQENLDLAIKEAEEWLEQLREIQPVSPDRYKDDD